MWKVAMPYLQFGVRKDFIVHTKGVIEAMKILLIQQRRPNRASVRKELLIISAILHDVGWSKVPIELQKSEKDWDIGEAMKLHIEYAPDVIREILSGLGYEDVFIDEVCDVVVAHKFQKPTDKSKQMLIDADTLSDIFEEQLKSDAKKYGLDLKKILEIRSKNTFRSDSARQIFEKELKKRKKEKKKLNKLECNKYWTCGVLIYVDIFI